jgi:hypothetical protein
MSVRVRTQRVRSPVTRATRVGRVDEHDELGGHRLVGGARCRTRAWPQEAAEQVALDGRAHGHGALVTQATECQHHAATAADRVAGAQRGAADRVGSDARARSDTDHDDRRALGDRRWDHERVVCHAPMERRRRAQRGLEVDAGRRLDRARTRPAVVVDGDDDDVRGWVARAGGAADAHAVSLARRQPYPVVVQDASPVRTRRERAPSPGSAYRFRFGRSSRADRRRRSSRRSCPGVPTSCRRCSGPRPGS